MERETQAVGQGEKLPSWVAEANIQLGKFKKALYGAVRDAKGDARLAEVVRANLGYIDILDENRRDGKISALGYWERIRDFLSDNDAWLNWNNETVEILFPEKFLRQ